jgi:hypothetical protein
MLDDLRDPKAFNGSGLIDSIYSSRRSETKWFTEYQGRELDFIGDVLGLRSAVTGKVQLWAAQRAIIEAVFKHRFVSVLSCRSGGKTFSSGVLTPTFFYTAPSRVLVTGPGMRQITKLSWAETRARIAAAPVKLPGEVLHTELRLDDQHYAICIPSKDPEHLRGFHAGVSVPGDPDADILSPDDLAHMIEGTDDATRMLVVIDEPEAVPAETFRVLQGMFNKSNVYCLMIGNPTLGRDEQDHEYVRSVQPDSGWHTIKISAFGEDEYEDDITYDQVFDHVPEYLVSKDALDKARRTLEPQDPIFLSDYLGQFPSGSTSKMVVPRSALESAMLTWTERKRPLGPRMGVDIGTGGADPCVAVMYMDGEKIVEHEWRPDSDDSEAQVTIASTIQGLAVRWGADLGEGDWDWDGQPIPGERVSIDASGMVGVADILSSRGYHVDAVNFGSRAPGQWTSIVGTERFKNTRVEMHWVARRGLQEGVFRIDPIKFPRSWQQATWTMFERRSDGYGSMVSLEPKDRVKARHGRSPDNWDADILAMRETTGGRMFGQLGGKMRQPIINGRVRRTPLAGARQWPR